MEIFCPKATAWYWTWFRTPQAQTVGLGLVFLLLFAAYTTIQFYAASTYGSTVAANSVSALYATFTISCFVAPAVANRLESPQLTMTVGILGGYVAFVLRSLLYFQGVCGSWIVVLGGIMLGFGAALLWTAQGQLLLEYAAVADRILASNNKPGHEAKQSQTGKLLGLFWAVFQCSSLIGGAISFAYYFRLGPATMVENDVDKPTGSTSLYLIFLSLMILSAIFSQFLLSPSSLELLPTESVSDEKDQLRIHQHTLPETTVLLPLIPNDIQSPGDADNKPTDNTPWREEVNAAVLLFTTNKSMQLLSLVFFYTGFSQPYQQATFTRFFSKRTIGVELILFHAMEIIGAIVCGRLLDRPLAGTTTAMQYLGIFLVVNSIGNSLAIVQEQEATAIESFDNTPALPIIDILASPWLSFLRPSCAFLCWGFADAQIQVYCYWLMGRLFRSSENSRAYFSRSVAFYKCLQSLGYTIGFCLIPVTRLSAMHQILVSSGAFLLGTGLAVFELMPS